MLWAFCAHVFLPLFSVRHPESWGVRLSFLLPPPRSILGALARGIGLILGIGSGDEKYRGETVRNILIYALEANGFVSVRLLSPLIKSSQMLRYVPAVEKAEPIEDPYAAHDAFKTDIVFSADMKFLFLIDVEAVNKVIQEYGLPKIDTKEVCDAIKLIDRIGPTESTCYVKTVNQLEVGQLYTAETHTPINTYTPYDWLEDIRGEYFIAELLPNLRTLQSIGMITQSTIKDVQDLELRRKTIPYVFPLKHVGKSKGAEIFEPSAGFEAKLGKGYVLYAFEDETKVVLPASEKIRT